MRRRWVRLTLGIMGGAVVLLVLAAVLVPLLVPRDRLRSMAENQIRERTGGEVALGELSLEVFPRLQLVLGESAVKVTGEGLREAGQQPGPLVSGALDLERLEVDLALWPLLRKQLEFGEVSLVRPRLELVTAAAEEEAPAGEGAPETAPAARQVDAGVGLALAAVSVRDGELLWREQGTGRAVAVRGWQQELEAPQLGTLLTRLQRMGGADLPADEVPEPVALALAARVASVELTGFGEQPLPPLEDLRLRGRIAAPPSADRLDFSVDELAAAGLSASARGHGDAAMVNLEELTVALGEAATLTGSARLGDLGERGAVSADLGGTVQLEQLTAAVEPFLPPRGEGAPPLPRLTGAVALNLVVELDQAPPLSDAEAWRQAWREGLAGTAALDARGGPVTIDHERLGHTLTVTTVGLTADLRSASGRTRLEVAGARYPGLAADAEASFVLPPAAGPLSASVKGDVDLAPLMTAVVPLLPERGEDAAPLPELTGRLAVNLVLDLPRAPALTDSAAWAAAHAAGLPGKAQLSLTGGSVEVDSPQLGEPLRIARVEFTSDLRSPTGRSRLELGGVRHSALAGDVVAAVIPGLDDDPTSVNLELPLLDLDALAELARASQEQASAGFSLVPAAHAAPAAEGPQVGELIPPDLAVDLEASVRELRFLQTPYTQLKLGGSLRERVIDVPRFEARLGDGRVRGSARLDYAGDPGGLATWDLRITGAPATVLMKPYLGDFAQYWSGTVNADGRGSCALADPDAVMETLSIEGDLSASNGVIDLREPLAEVQQYLGKRQDLLRVSYSAADQDYVVRDGKLVIKSMRIDGKDTDWLGSGTIGLQGDLNMDLSVRLPAGYTPDLGDATFLADALRDDQGRIGLDFALTGTTRKPAVKLKLDPAELMKSDAVQDKLEDEVKKGLGGLLDRLKGK